MLNFHFQMYTIFETIKILRMTITLCAREEIPKVSFPKNYLMMKCRLSLKSKKKDITLSKKRKKWSKVVLRIYIFYCIKCCYFSVRVRSALPEGVYHRKNAKASCVYLKQMQREKGKGCQKEKGFDSILLNYCTKQ